jgi:hypothetical protein
VAVAALVLYVDGDYALWALFAFLLTPDLSFAAYLAGPRVGAVVYDLAARMPSRSPLLPRAC